MQSVSSRIWTRVAVSISYDDNHYTIGTSIFDLLLIVLMALFRVASRMKRFSFSLKIFLSYPCSSLLVWDFACFSLEISIQLFSSHFCFLVIVDLLILVLLVLFLIAAISITLLFFKLFSRLLIEVSTLSWILFLLLFLSHIVCLYHLSGVKS